MQRKKNVEYLTYNNLSMLHYLQLFNKFSAVRKNNLSRFVMSCLGLWCYRSQRLLDYLAFQFFDWVYRMNIISETHQWNNLVFILSAQRQTIGKLNNIKVYVLIANELKLISYEEQSIYMTSSTVVLLLFCMQ